jgi:hypothetical protein
VEDGVLDTEPIYSAGYDESFRSEFRAPASSARRSSSNPDPSEIESGSTNSALMELEARCDGRGGLGELLSTG